MNTVKESHIPSFWDRSPRASQIYALFDGAETPERQPVRAAQFVSSFFKSDTVKVPQAFTITVAEAQELGRDGDKETKLVLYSKEDPRGLVLNKTNLDFLIQTTGTDETNEWTGKTFELFYDPNVFFSGKRVGGLKLRLPEVK